MKINIIPTWFRLFMGLVIISYFFSMVTLAADNKISAEMIEAEIQEQVVDPCFKIIDKTYAGRKGRSGMPLEMYKGGWNKGEKIFQSIYDSMIEEDRLIVRANLYEHMKIECVLFIQRGMSYRPGYR